MDYTRIPDELKKLPQWVCAWDNSKIPMKAFEKKAASSTAPETWATFDQAEAAVKDGLYDHLGFVFAGSDLVGIDIAAVYGDEVYIIDVVFDDSPPEVTKPECAKALMDNKVVACTFESNNAGSYFARDVQDIMTKREYVCNVRTKRTISNKQTRIEFASDTILKNFYFKDPSLYARNSQYAAFIKQVITYTRSGKVPHDDAPDSLSLLENELRGLVGAKVEVFKRPC